MDKRDIIKQLHDSPLFKAAMSLATDEREARIARSFAEEFLISTVSAMQTVSEEYKRDPQAFSKQLDNLSEELVKSEDAET